ncbi:xanthine dehydrogenase family protein molybdopterin-binding subunit [Fulvivirga sedimenti]|uniref:Molybdopterin-dependent oxidoreductase n=1 Tax=Fulvivirga sedimenti TaxID=2879465 RepID=A0A9X1KWU0_9BACT|nr:molybdopterin cofactor-binding domain-containing protein [Fulvivirga sedimenti]MCA6074299.1 molybdopterin-dependent oxidoreductase [Fulvivirga sedimenti]
MESLSRRTFLKQSSLTGLFFVLGSTAENGLMASLIQDPGSVNLNQFIAISSDNKIVLFNHRPEMGQGTYQSIPMILAEELEVDIHSVEIRQSEADSDLYGSQMVVGSRSIQTEYDTLRIMGASAREMLKSAAAKRFNTNSDSCKAENGKIFGPGGKSLTYGELIADAAKITPPKNPPLKDPADFKIIGQPISRQDIPGKVNGQAQYGLDVNVPGMLYASVERSPVFLGKVMGFNDSEVLKVPGVRHVIPTSRNVYGQTREGVAVLADNYWAALKGRKVLKVEWDNQGLDTISGADIVADSYESAEGNGDELFGRGNTAEIFRNSDQIIEASYETPYQAHVPMEPMNATVHIQADRAEFWGSTQNPNGVKSFIAQTYGIDPAKVKINYTFMGGGFGRRSMTDVVEEAADLSKKSGKPVKVIWTREDDQTQGPFRACSVNICKAVMEPGGKILAFEHKVIAQEIRNQTGKDMTAGRQLMGGINTEYTIPNFSVKGVLKKRHIPISYWRAVYHSTNPFAHECFIDELSRVAGKDPLTFRLEMLNHPRYRRVLEEIGKRTDWFGQPEPGIGRGLATVERSGAYFAMITKVTKRDGKIIPIKITTVLDLGVCINPDTVKAQTEGSVIMGLGAFYNGLTIKNGAVEENNFHTYPLPRIDQIPEIETHILSSNASPDGAGESGLPTLAPSLANAIFDLTGNRIRKLPIQYGAGA